MSMVQVGVVGMRVDQRSVDVRMSVRLLSIPGEIMFMLMVLIMGMRMPVFLVFMDVPMCMPLRYVQPDADRHRRTGDDELPGDRLAV